MQIASERGKLAFGQDSDMIKFGPKTQLTSIIDNWAPYYIERVKAELDGTWKSEDTWGGLEGQDGRDGALHQHARRREEDARTPKPRSSPASCIRSSARSSARTARTVECKGGDHLDDGQILGMNFYVKGIDDKIPAK